MNIFFSLLIGYLLGCLNPAFFLSKLKKINLRKHGTGNLGAVNVLLILGIFYFVAVMLLDMAKAFIAFKISQTLFPELGVTGADGRLAGLIAGLGAVIGHLFPFYLKFKGGKGLAPFAGTALAYEPLLFLALLITAMVLMLIVNYSFIVPYSASVLFCTVSTAMSLNVFVFLLSAASGGLVMWKHFENIVKAKNGTDVKVREYILSLFTKKNTKAVPYEGEEVPVVEDFAEENGDIE